MRISDLIKMGFKNLFRRKARTALTVIGVVIGTISIVVMVSIGMGMNASFDSQVMQSGSLTTINVYANDYVYDETTDSGYEVKQKLDSNFITMVEGLDHVKAATPYIQNWSMLISGKYYGSAGIVAIDFDTLDDFEYPQIASGAQLSENSKEIFLVGANVCTSFYNPNSRNYAPIEIDMTKKKVKFQFPGEYQPAEGKSPYTVQMNNVGILELTDNWEYDQYIFVDIDFYKEMYEKYCKTLTSASRKLAMKSIDTYSQVNICVDSIKNVTEVQDKLKELGYQASSMMTYLEPMQQTSEMLQLVLGCIGGVSMLVSAISIANTMIMSIYERTKEIGVMKVLGCYVRDIKKLFLFESGTIGFLGGAVGIICSYVASWAINKYGAPLFQSLMQSSYMFMGDGSATDFSIIPFWLPVAALLFAMFVGIVSGYYPASRATKISAIEAMKTET